MALIKCNECGKEISDKAKQCPHCGYKYYKENKKCKGKKIIILFSILGVILFISLIIIISKKIILQKRINEVSGNWYYMEKSYTNGGYSYESVNLYDNLTCEYSSAYYFEGEVFLPMKYSCSWEFDDDEIILHLGDTQFGYGYDKTTDTLYEINYETTGRDKEFKRDNN